MDWNDSFTSSNPMPTLASQRSALISFPKACMGPRQCPHAGLSSSHLVEGLTNPPPLEVVLVLHEFNRAYLLIWSSNCNKVAPFSTSVGHSLGAGMKTAYLENLSTTTKTDLKPSTFGNPLMNTIDKHCHGLFRMGKGCNKPASFFRSVLST